MQGSRQTDLHTCPNPLQAQGCQAVLRAAVVVSKPEQQRVWEVGPCTPCPHSRRLTERKGGWSHFNTRCQPCLAVKRAKGRAGGGERAR